MRFRAPFFEALFLWSFAIPLGVGCGASHDATPEPAPAPVGAPMVLPAGMTVERVAGPPAEGRGDGMVTLVRIDMGTHRLGMVSATAEDGSFRSVPEWSTRAHFVAAINAALFEPDGRATGLFVLDGVERSPDDVRFGGILAFDPIDPVDPPFVLAGRDCPGVDLGSLRARYRNLVANYRMLGCAGEPIAWLDEDRYSSAAFGLDRQGRFVLIHATTPYRMAELAETLAQPSLGLTDVHYVEGGPKATVFVAGGMTLVGRWEDDLDTHDRAPRPIPNVLGVIAR